MKKNLDNRIKKIVKLESLFKLLNNYNRLAILKVLKSNPELPVWEIADKINAPHKRTSKHLRILLEGGLIDRDQDYFEALYSISDENSRFIKYIIREL